MCFFVPAPAQGSKRAGAEDCVFNRRLIVLFEKPQEPPCGRAGPAAPSTSAFPGPDGD
jgi:hypothetical protein